MNETVWCVGRVHLKEEKWSWALMGIFQTEEMAVAMCSTVNDFVGSLQRDVLLPDNTVDWPGAYYPLTRKE